MYWFVTSDDGILVLFPNWNFTLNIFGAERSACPDTGAPFSSNIVSLHPLMSIVFDTVLMLCPIASSTTTSKDVVFGSIWDSYTSLCIVELVFCCKNGWSCDNCAGTIPDGVFSITVG